jgi:hypothetical protein
MSRIPLCAAVAAGCVLFGPPLYAAPSLHAAPAGFIPAADDGIVVHEAWAGASPGDSTTGAAYVTLMGGSRPDSLVSVSTPVAATAGVHETINDHGIMKMRPAGPVPLPPGEMVTFAPGGMHIMLTGLKQKLVAGQSFPLTLTFAHAGPITVQVTVRGLGRAMDGHGGMHMQ